MTLFACGRVAPPGCTCRLQLFRISRSGRRTATTDSLSAGRSAARRSRQVQGSNRFPYQTFTAFCGEIASYPSVQAVTDYAAEAAPAVSDRMAFRKTELPNALKQQSAWPFSLQMNPGGLSKRKKVLYFMSFGGAQRRAHKPAGSPYGHRLAPSGVSWQAPCIADRKRSRRSS